MNTTKQSLEKKVYFSIILPTHNRVDLLPLALESVRSQTYKNYELIVINDGSTDDTAGFLESIVAGFKNFQVIFHPVAKGVAASRNAGLKVARGEFAVFLDDDDQFKPTLLEKLAAAIKNYDPYPAILWTGRVEYHHKSDGSQIILNQIWPPNPENIAPGDYNFATHFGAGWGVAVNIKKIISLGCFNEFMTTSEDADLLLRILNQGLTWFVIPEYLIEVHIQEQISLSRNKRYSEYANNLKLLLASNEKLLKRFPKLRCHYKRSYMNFLYKAGYKKQAHKVAEELLAESFFDFKTWENIIRFEVLKPLKNAVKRSPQKIQ